MLGSTATLIRGASQQLLFTSFSPLFFKNYFHNFTSINTSRSFSIMATSDEFVRGNVHQNGVAVLTLDRPKALNAMNLGSRILFIYRDYYVYETILFIYRDYCFYEFQNFIHLSRLLHLRHDLFNYRDYCLYAFQNFIYLLRLLVYQF